MTDTAQRLTGVAAPVRELSRDAITAIRTALTWARDRRYLVRAGRLAIVDYVRSAPATFIWLSVLFMTSTAAQNMPHHHLDQILRTRSTNIEHLQTNPVPSLVRSALWIDGSVWLMWALVFAIIVAPVERWLGTRRWVMVVILGHVGATYLSQGVLLWAIDTGRAPHSMTGVIDIGVSYGVAAVAGVLTYRIPRRWRLVYLATLAAWAADPFVEQFYGGAHATFTDVGHLCAGLIGLACYPLTFRAQVPTVFGVAKSPTWWGLRYPIHGFEAFLAGPAVARTRARSVRWINRGHWSGDSDRPRRQSHPR
ncbi:rhomboid-like protein [Williamsia sp. CHRR-6]|uniref:rhomboid-like protein n=1 Tax=Williamsia sp. CHRR-6 TaxID=2835871 RepID=UPI001BDB2B53|nr:rhomboid-like protein [Williamsia sp. CHRR-6]MBT0566788.1 hypothetical protein [Williamsia sp. CHRR-6]